jgi:hypothetical protein
VTSGQSQKAGQGARQIQVAGDLILNQGITEERALEIARLEARRLMEEQAIEAWSSIEKRLEDFEHRAVSALSRKGTLNSFADPAFIKTFKKAQDSAAATARAEDHDMLAALLADRAENSQNRPAIAGINRAVEVVDQVADDALRGVTVIYAMSQWVPASGSIADGISTLESIFAELVDGPLPQGRDWIDHLDILSVVRASTMTEFKPFDEYYPGQFPGFIASGVLTESAPAEIADVPGHLPWGLLVTEHELKPGYSRVRTTNAHLLDKHLRLNGFPEEYRTAIVEQARSVFGLDNGDPAVKTELATRMRAEPTLGRIAEWWGKLPYHFEITAVGRALATANAFRLDVARRLPRDETKAEPPASPDN